MSTPSRRPPPVTVEIGTLVLHGVAAHQARALVAGLERELGRLLAHPSVPSALTAAPPRRERLDAGTVRAGRPDGLARAVYRQIVARAAPPPTTRTAGTAGGKR